jgi:peroxisome-assembly ATPase
MQVTTISDAMILARLFRSLFDTKKFILVATSNRHPKDLYLNGIQRASFLPCIALLEERTTVLPLRSAIDYRKRAVSLAPDTRSSTYFWPLTQKIEQQFSLLFTELVAEKGQVIKPVTLTVFGRPWLIDSASANIAKCSFKELCETPKNSDDYNALASYFKILFVTGIPIFSLEKRNELRRFIHLIDALYNYRVKLFCTAEAALTDLLQISSNSQSLNSPNIIENAEMPIITDNTSFSTGAEEIFAFQRALSRLHEMHSSAW